MRERARPLALAGIVALGLVGLMILAAATPWDSGRKLVVVGDSMAVLSADHLREAGREAGFDVAVEAQAGIPLSARLDLLERVAQSRPGPIVVELGTNDVLNGVTESALDALVDNAVTIMRDAGCVVFVDVGVVNRPSALADHFNERLAAGIAQHPNEHEFDWASIYHEHPDWAIDGVHLREAYRGQYAQGIIDAVRHACP
jgi:hypothetical protein